jgi:hypothetical protein
MRYSLLFTLAKKHKTSTSKMIQMIGKNSSVYVNIGNNKLKKVASFITPAFLNSIKSGFDVTFNSAPTISTLKNPSIHSSIPKVLYHKCQIKSCGETNVKIFHFKTFHNKIFPNYAITSLKMHKTKIIEFALSKKQISLCRKHYLAIHASKLFLEDLAADSKSFKLLNFEKRAIHF